MTNVFSVVPRHKFLPLDFPHKKDNQVEQERLSWSRGSPMSFKHDTAKLIELGGDFLKTKK